MVVRVMLPVLMTPASYPAHRRQLPCGRWLTLVALIASFLTSAAASPPALSHDDSAFLDRLQRSAFDYFWQETNAANGLIKDRSTADSKCSIAAVGFGLSALAVAIERGWISRESGRERVVTTLRTFADGKQSPDPEGAIGYRGWFYHFLDMDTATRGLTGWKSELSSIDTALLLAGALHAREFFDEQNSEEARIRAFAEKLVRGVDWEWMADQGALFRGGWTPESGFMNHRWEGYSEAMLLYLIALGADALESALQTDRKAPVSWNAWTRTYQWASHYQFEYIQFPPLFGHQYSHCWIDFRGIADSYLREKKIDYFENSRRATLAQRAYCITNPGRFPNYGPLEWGLSACDGPGRNGYAGYRARGAPPAENDDGTIAPTAVAGSLPFAPEICLPTLRNFETRYRGQLWTRYGFGDAFNVKANWFASVTLGIDQGPIVLMAENYRSGAVWKRMMRSAVVQRGLERAEFRRLAP
jgi:hypothetical protein